MTWLRQVGHVAAKDVRMGRYVGAAFVLLVLLLSFQTGGSVSTVWALLVLLTGPIAVAQAVHADAAIRDEAFWVSRPLSPGAVFGAKVVIVLLLVAVVLLGEVVVLLRHAVSAGEVPHLLLTTAVGEATILCVGLLVATLTRDGRTFLLTILLGLIASVIVGGLLSAYFAVHHVTGPSGLAPALTVSGALAISGYQYLSGRRLRAAAAAIVVVTGAVILLSLSSTGFGGQRASGRTLAPGLRPDSILATSYAPTPGRGDARRVSLRLVGGSRQLTYALLDPSVVIRRPDGSHGTQRLYMPMQLSASRAIVPPVPGARWVNLGNPAPGRFQSALSSLNDVLADSAVQVTGTVQASEPSIGARIPLRAGAAVAQDGQRIHIESADVSGGQVSIKLVISRVGREDQSFFGDPLEYALLDRGRGLVFPLARANTSGSSNGPLSGMPSLLNVTLRRPPAVGGPQVRPEGPGPYELLLVDWTPVGSFPVSLPIVPAAPGAEVPGAKGTTLAPEPAG